MILDIPHDAVHLHTLVLGGLKGEIVEQRLSMGGPRENTEYLAVKSVIMGQGAVEGNGIEGASSYKETPPDILVYVRTE